MLNSMEKTVIKNILSLSGTELELTHHYPMLSLKLKRQVGQPKTISLLSQKMENSLVVELKSGSTIENTVRVPGLDNELKQLGWTYIGVSVNLSTNKLNAYVYFEETGLGRFISNTGKPFPSVINSSDKFTVNFGTSKSRFTFDISGFIVIRANFDQNSQFEEIRFRVPDSTNQHCLDATTNGVCLNYPRLSIEDLGEASRAHGKFDEASLKNLPLFKSLSSYIDKSTSNLRFQEYLIAFKIQLKHCYSNEYKANSRVAFSLVNIKPDHTLTYADVIPDNLIKYSALSLEIRDNSLRLYAGGNMVHNEVSSSDFHLGKDSFKSLNNIIVQILVQSKNKIIVQLSLDDLKVDFKFYSKNAIEALTKNTGLFVNPFVSDMRLQVRDPRFSRDTEKYIEGRSDYQHTSASSLCSGKAQGCEKCFLFNFDSDYLVCSRCNKDSALFNGSCIKKKN